MGRADARHTLGSMRRRVRDMPSISKLLSERWHLRLTPDAKSWFDGGWREVAGSEMSFNEVIDPEEMQERIWAGLMPPDTLPIAGDGSGDCLLARFGQDGALAEVIAWNHETGGWTHCGTTIQEAVTLDRIMHPHE